MSGLTGPGELVLPGPNGKAVASLRDYARDMTCLRGQLRVFRKQTNMADVVSFLIVCEFFWCGEEEVAMENEIEEDVVFFSAIRLFMRREISRYTVGDIERLSDRAPSLFLSHFPRGEIGLLFFLNRYKQFGVHVLNNGTSIVFEKWRTLFIFARYPRGCVAALSALWARTGRTHWPYTHNRTSLSGTSSRNSRVPFKNSLA